MAQTVQQLELAALQALTSFPFLQGETGLEAADFTIEPFQAYLGALVETRYLLDDGSASALEVGQRAGWTRDQVVERFSVRFQILAQARDTVRKLRAEGLSRRFRTEMIRLMGESSDGQLVGRAEELAREYSRRLEAGTSSVTNMEAVTLRFLEEQRRRLTQGASRIVLPTGLPTLDAAMRGWRAGELTTLVAAGGTGKSTLAEFWRRTLGKQGVHSLKFSGEMTEEQEGERTAHAECWVPMGDHLDNLFTLDAAGAAIQQSGVLKRLLLDTRSRMDPRYMRSVIESKKVEHGELGLVVIDHLRHLEVQTTDKSDYAFVSAAAEESKALAKDCRVPVLLITHTNRRAEEAMTKGGGSTPDPGMIRGSGRIFEESDNVLCLWRPEAVIDLWVWKARQTGCKNKKIILEYDMRTQEYHEP